MKKLLLGFIALGSISSFANNECVNIPYEKTASGAPYQTPAGFVEVCADLSPTESGFEIHNLSRNIMPGVSIMDGMLGGFYKRGRVAEILCESFTNKKPIKTSVKVSKGYGALELFGRFSGAEKRSYREQWSWIGDKPQIETKVKIIKSINCINL